MRLAVSTYTAHPSGRFASCGLARAHTSAWERRLPARKSPICCKHSWRKRGHGESFIDALPVTSSFPPMRSSRSPVLPGRARVSNERVILAPILTVVFVDTLGYAAVVPLIPFALRDAHAPLLGRLSDRVGRRPVLVLSLAGSVVGFALLAISSAFPVVLLSRVIDGSSAGNVAMCYAAVLDSGTEDTRRRWIPALGAAAGAGIVAGLGLSALLAGFGFRAVALAAMFLSLLCLALTLIAVPETRRGSILNLKVSAA